MTPTHLACLTPTGTGAIAALSLCGPLAWTSVRELAHRPLPLLPEPGRFWLTQLGDKEKREVDNVIVAVKRAVPEPVVELHCHGGREVISLLTDLFRSRGVVVSTWQEYGRAIHGARWRTAAMEVLTKAQTARTAGIALDQYQGALILALRRVGSALERGEISEADSILKELGHYASVGMHLTAPWRVVIAGAANVGKSSLVNALAGYQRSIVSPLPGTTRDVVTTLLAVDGWPLEVSDTAGWRSNFTELEGEGIARAKQAITSADLCLWLLDAAAVPIWPENVNLNHMHCVVNKIDLPPAWSIDAVNAIQVSAQTGAGLAELCQAISTWLVPAIPPPSAAVPFTAEIVAEVAEISLLARAGMVLEALGNLEKLCRECD